MTVAEWCVFGTLMLYLLTIASVKWAGHRHFDNARPRDPAFYEDAIRARALVMSLPPRRAGMSLFGKTLETVLAERPCRVIIESSRGVETKRRAA